MYAHLRVVSLFLSACLHRKYIMYEGDGISSFNCIVSDKGSVPWAEESKDMASSAPVKVINWPTEHTVGLT